MPSFLSPGVVLLSESLSWHSLLPDPAQQTTRNSFKPSCITRRQVGLPSQVPTTLTSSSLSESEITRVLSSSPSSLLLSVRRTFLRLSFCPVLRFLRGITLYRVKSYTSRQTLLTSNNLTSLLDISKANTLT